MINSGGKLSKNYVTLEMPGEKYTAPEAGDYIDGYASAVETVSAAEEPVTDVAPEAPSEPDSSEPSYTAAVWIVVVVAVVVMGAAVGFGKRRK